VGDEVAVRFRALQGRSNVALAGCVFSVMIGLAAILRGYDPFDTAQDVSFAWLIIWTWLGKRFELFGMRRKQIYEAFRKEQVLPLPFDTMIFRGSVILTLVSMVGWFR
jgi:hypothetical protein